MMTARERIEAAIDSCACLQGPTPNPCDGWLQHRKCDSLAEALEVVVWQAVDEEAEDRRDILKERREFFIKTCEQAEEIERLKRELEQIKGPPRVTS